MHGDLGADGAEQLRCVVARNVYGSYCIPSSSGFRSCAKIVAGGRVFEPRTIEFMAQHMGDGDVIHAGAFFGDFFPALSRAAAPEAAIWSFEPSRENFVCASITIQLNGIENIRLVRAGLGAEASQASMRTVDSQGRPLGEESFITEVEVSGAGANEEIDIVRLDDMIPKDRKVSILQLDVEGYEQVALSGALDLIRRDLPILILEKLPAQSWIAERLTPLGYQVRGGLHGNTILSVRPVVPYSQYLRLAVRNWLKRIVPNRLRRRFRAAEAQHLGRNLALEDISSLPPFVVEGRAYKLLAT